jgi:hypothetical protein
MINGILGALFGEEFIAYQDDILIYFEEKESHIHLVRWVMEHIRKANLCVSINKSVVHQRKVMFLGYHMLEKSISMTSEKVEAVRR